MSKPKVRGQLQAQTEEGAAHSHGTRTSQTDDEKWQQVTLRSSAENGTKGMRIVTRGRSVSGVSSRRA